MSTLRPKISILLPVYNGERFIQQAVDSILSQSFKNFELLVINDGSSDATGEVLAGIGDARLRILEQDNRGLVASLNRGIAEARGKYIARMDHDDISLPRRLELQYHYLDNRPEHVAVGCLFAQLDEAGDLLNQGVTLPLEHEDIYTAISQGRLGVLHPTMMICRQALLAVGGYDERIPHSEDVDLIYKLACRGKLANVEAVAYLYRITPSAVSTAQFTRQRRIERVLLEAWHRARNTGVYRLNRVEYARLEETGIDSPTPDMIAAHYHNRVGRALLRGGRWGPAAAHYFTSIRHRPMQWLAYTGLLRALLHIGRTRLPAGMKEAGEFEGKE